MTAVFRAHRRAEEFDAVVDGRLAADDGRAELRELAGIVTVLRGQEPVAPSADFTVALRTRLMAEAETVLSPSHASLRLPARRRGSRERRLVAAASAVVLFGGTASMAVAAQHALPGEALYPIKRGIEHAQAGLSTSPAGKGRDLLHQADDRLAEVQGLLADGSGNGTPQIPGTIDDFTAQAQEGAGLLLTSFQDSRDPATVVAVRIFAAHSITALQEMARTAPPDAQDELAAAATALSDIDARARDLCDTCASNLPDLDVPSMFLAASEVDRALRAIHVDGLDNSHPVPIDKGALKAPLAGSGPTAPSSPSASPSPSGVLPGTAPGTGPTSLLPKLPGTDEQAKKGSVDGTVSGITDGLSGVVETLLPDPDLP